MTIYIQAKQPGKRKPYVAACRYDLEEKPRTLRDLIRMLVCDGVSAYNSRIGEKHDGTPLSSEELEDMGQVGKIAFGIPYGTREADCEAALETAYQGYSDGLLRIFIGQREIETLDGPLELGDGDTVTIIRLVMLTGGFFW